MKRFLLTLVLPSRILFNRNYLTKCVSGENFSSQKYVGHLFDVVFPATKTTSLKCILLTHGHGDHLGGVSDILKECAKRRWPIPSIHKKLVQNGDFPPVGFTAEHIANDEVFGVEGATIRTIYTPGHTDDHVCFVLEVLRVHSIYNRVVRSSSLFCAGG